MSGEAVISESCFHPRPERRADPESAGRECFFAAVPNSVMYYDDAKSTPIKGYPMSALYSGLPAATSVEQSIILAQLELLRRLDPARVEAAKAVLLRN